MTKIRKNALYMALIWGHSGTLHRDMGPQGGPMDHPNTLGIDFGEYLKTPYKGPAQEFSGPKHVLTDTLAFGHLMAR